MRGPDDRDRLRRGGGWTPFPPEALRQGIPARFAGQVRAHGSRPAVASAGGTWTYEALAARAWRIAHAILARRGDAEEPVVLLLRQGPGQIAATLGALAAGKIYVPVDPRADPVRAGGILADCEPALVLLAGQDRALAGRWVGQDRLLPLDDLGPGPADDPAVASGPDRAAYVYYTSGSTGRPKGVVDCHQNVLHNVLRYTDSLRVGCEDRLTLLQSPAFSGTVSSLFTAVLNGAASHVVDLPAEGIQGLARRIQAERISIFHAVPAIFRALAAADADLSSLRVVRLEGDLATRRDGLLFQERMGDGCLLVNGLGATETGLTCQFFLARGTPLPDGALPVGYPTVDVEVAILGEAGLPATPGEIGEIVIASPYLALGYRGDEARTAERFRPDGAGGRRYHTGDLGRRRPDGAVELLGRKDLQARLDGAFIDLPALEAALVRLEGVHEAAAAVLGGPAGRPELAAFLVAAGGTDVAALGARLRAAAPGLPVPTRWTLLDALPEDANGKIDRARLPDAAGRRHPRQDGQRAATTAEDLAGIVAACWRERLGADDGRSFGDAGGDSLAALELALLLEQRLGRPVAPDLIEPDLTLAGLAARLGGAEDGCVALLAPGGAGPPLFLFHGVQGEVTGYRALARRLAGTRPVYGVRLPTPRAGEPPPASLAALAERYAGEIRPFLKEVPATLAGNCSGGVLALETARRLQAAGVAVAPPVLIDTAFPDTLVHRLRGHAAALLTGRPADSPTRDTLPAGRAAIALRMAGWLIAKVRRRVGVWAWRGSARLGLRPHRLAIRPPMMILGHGRHRPCPRADRAVLVCAGGLTNQRGWDTVVLGGLETVVLPARRDAPHPRHLVEEPYVDDLAAALSTR